MADGTLHRIALVSGASRGLGFAVGEALGRKGSHVIALARTVGGLEELDDKIKASEGSTTLVPLDVTDDPGLERLGAAIHDRWGRLDLWVHTAVHAVPLAPVEHIDAKDLDRALAVNFRAVQRLIRVLDPLLRQSSSGRAVFFRDLNVLEKTFHATYHAPKIAAEEVIQDWAKTAEKTSPVKVEFACPPPMRTALRARLYPGEAIQQQIPPSEVANNLVAAMERAVRGPYDLRPD
jgi:NAD(P)-dependent dehydrogenase (short-subunit alcohol dehydrogenase family)